ncbi:MAG: hypothetical protein IKS09_04045 [Lachnospiraceae bacterium]|nr:hypothetical protein [Lachnospiraceae bacterium]
MNISQIDINTALALTRNLKNFPGLLKYKNDINFLKDNEEFANDVIEGALDDSKNIEHASGIKQTLYNPDGKHYNNIKGYLTDTLHFTRRLLADKELMEKEPFLKAYVGMCNTMLERSLSDRADANDHYADETMHIALFALDQFDKLPTAEQYKNLNPKEKEGADKMLKFMTAYRNCYDFKGHVEKAVDEKPGMVNRDKYRAEQLRYMRNLNETIENWREPAYDIYEFFNKTGNKNNLADNVRGLSKGKQNITTIKEQFAKRINGVQKNLTPEESRILEGYSKQVNNELKTAFGMGGTTPDMLPEAYREPVKEIIELAKECGRKFEQGFSSPEAKEKFFKNLGEKTEEFIRKIDDTRRPANMTREENRALTNIAGILRENAGNEMSALGQARRVGKEFNSIDMATSPEFREKLGLFYDMMENTGEGYFMHKNSKEYTNMMETARSLYIMSGKEELTDLDRKILGERFVKLSKVTQEYLSDRKIGNKSTEVGEDRFAGALGMLNLVDPENGEKVRARAEAKRGKAVSFEKIEKRAVNKMKAADAAEAAKEAKMAKKNAKAEKKMADKIRRM